MSLFLMMALPGICMAWDLKPGEKIHYKIQQIGLKTGNATLIFAGPKVYRKRHTLLIIFEAKGFNFFDEERIYVSPGNFKPLFVERNLNIFGKKERILEEYSDGHIKIIKGKNQQTIDKAGWTDNIFAFIYRYRKQGSFKIGDTLDIHLPTKDMTVKLLRQDSMNVAGKKQHSFYMESDSGNYKIWFDASEKKIPLRISGAIKMANTVMVMTKYEE